MDIFVSTDEEYVGPYSPLEICGRLSDGRLQLSDKAWHDGLAKWLPLSEIDAVSSLLASRKSTFAEFVPVEVKASLKPSLIDTVSCPFCVEPIRRGALKCKHCREMLDPQLLTMREAQRTPRTSASHVDCLQQNFAFRKVTADDPPQHDFPHVMHLIVTIPTLGLWIPIWFIHYMLRNRHHYR